MLPTMGALPRWVVVLSIFGGTWLFTALVAAGWGGWTGLLDNPVRLATIVASFALALVASFSDVNLSAGKREGTGSRAVFVPALLGSGLLAWLPAYLDRHDLWVIDGDTVRWVGFALVVVGGIARVWPMFVLGRRFSGLVAIQEGHELETDGLYGVIRHPSYLGGLVCLAGWVLVFRCGVGLLLVAGGLWLTITRIDVEEVLLASEFGPAWEEYRKRTWRLVPWVY
jgi:protein-S-isoprenylcysteine O-methyltransferase Ste14